jgi:epsin
MSIKSVIRQAKNAVLQFDPIEVQVREATSSDRWMVPDSALSEIARASNDYQDYPKMFAMLWKRLTDHEHVMHVQKALILIEYLVRYGSVRFIQDAQSRRRDISNLVAYKHYDENNQDDGKEVRSKAKVLSELLANDSMIREEREKANKLRENMKGFSNTDY